MSYKYESPRHWLMSTYIPTKDKDELIGIIDQLADRLSSDDLQDLFQSEMDADGYFEEMKD